MNFISIVTKTQQNNWGKNPINLPGIKRLTFQQYVYLFSIDSSF